uniref:protein FAR1-RELATED SEQUENCE 6-like n=1 Tax=Erigeron canadensis TaxID=72917 RepID=UPI001CB9AE33|nr:protein FAR1-RELATED SEQUENCE 6-like [Erigeron canadensis]
METNQNANVDEDVDSTANNAPAESSSFSISNTNLYTSRTEELYDDDSCTPIVDDNLKPVKGTIFKTIEEAIQMYEKYAYEAAFDTKLSQQGRLKSGKVQTKYIWCSKSGNSQDVSMDTLNLEERERRSSIMVTGCKAHVFFKIVEHNRTYELTDFVEKHNHKMNAGEYRYLSKKHRKLGISEINFIQKVSTSDIGPTRAHHIYSNLVGSQKNTHGTVVDFKNHKMAINCLIGSDDSQMLINKMDNRKDCVSGFFLNIRYNMIFVPFTAIDNHKKTVSIGAGMIINETAESYEWLLRAFLGAFVEQPRMVVTDQDVSMKKAIATVFPDSRHRLCMWHITQKLSSKVSKRIFENTDFKRNSTKLIVWDVSISPERFERKWKEIMKEFNLEDDAWFKHMYESENSFFNNFTNPYATLLHFMMSYESAMERQGNRLEILDHQSHNKQPSIMIALNFERQASKLYTWTIFLLVQEEIKQCLYNCSQISVSNEGSNEVIIIKENREINKKPEKKPPRNKKRKEYEDEDIVEDIVTVHEEDPEDGIEESTKNAKRHTASTSGTTALKRIYTFKVLLNKDEDTIKCSCLTFERYGFLCRHIFCMFKANDIQEIPEKYILRRWRKDLVPPGMRTRRKRFGESSEECDKLANELHFIVENCVSILSKDIPKLSDFVEKVRELKDKIEDNVSTSRTKKTKEVILDFLGVQQPETREVENPAVVRYKGSHSDSRLKSSKEIAMEEYAKPKRKCANCGLMTNPDKRNCAKKKLEEEKAKAVAETLQRFKKKISTKGSFKKVECVGYSVFTLQ